ncbi:MAG: phage tail sheath family protein [Oscillospiraceae bacterium]|jgi:hypothetical protein|nr:phage tail sheath family protein [Oscillospiraceae bacterium]
MAGGTFTPGLEKVRPGIYINLESSRPEPTPQEVAGTVVIPLVGHDYGPAGEFIALDKTAPDKQITKLGYSIYDDDPSGNMLMIREAFKRARVVLAYIPTAGTAANGVVTTGADKTLVTLNASAKYGGTRGNALSFSIVANPVAGFDVTVYLDGAAVALYKGLATIADLAAQNNAYITFSGTDGGALPPTAGLTLTGGANATTSNNDIAAFLDAVETVHFNALAAPFTDSDLQQIVAEKIRVLRDSVGKTVTAVVAGFAANHEGIVNLTNSYSVGGTALTVAQATAWVAAACAAATYTQSNTNTVVEGALRVVDEKTNEDAEAAILAGEFFFSTSDAGTVMVEYDINSLTDFAKPKDKSYRKNRVIRVFDAFRRALLETFTPGKFDNNEEGFDVREGLGRAILLRFQGDGAIKNVDEQNDFVIDRGASQDDSTYFTVGIQAVDSADKSYFTVKTR